MKGKNNRKKIRILAAILSFLLVMTDASIFASAESAADNAPLSGEAVTISVEAEDEIMPIADSDTEQPGEEQDDEQDEIVPIIVSTPSAWAEKEVNLASGAGLITEEQSFEFQTAITRGKYCQIIYNLIQADKIRNGEIIPEVPEAVEPETVEPEPEEKEPSPFIDTEDKAIIELFKLGIVNGMGNATFNPDGTLTREQAACILTRTANYLKINNPNGSLPAFYDGTKMSAWAIQSIKFIAAQKSQSGTAVMGGYDSRFDPKGTLTCEQAIISAYRLFDSIPMGDKGDTSWKNRHEWLLTEVTLSAAGDCTLGRDHGSAYANSLDAVYDYSGGNAAIFFRNVSQFFNDDITIVNFEGTLTNAANPATKTFRFKGRKEYTNILKFGSIDVVNFANNHAHDYLQVGYNDTIKNLKEAGIGVAGYDYIYTKEVKGIKIGFYGLAPMESGLSADYKSRITRLITALKNDGAQYIVGSFHWGIERNYNQNANQVALAHYAIDSGTDLVLGHHPHVLQGTEVYKGAQIAYSLGNFCFGGNRNPGDKDTAVLQEKITFDLETGKALKRSRVFYPYRLSSVTYKNDYQPVPVTGADANRVYSKLKLW